MNKWQMVIFDMDGLLFDTEQLYFKSLRAAMKQFGFAFTLKDYKRMVGTDDAETDRMVQELCAPDFSTAPLWEESHRQFDKMLVGSGLPIKPGAIKLLDALDKLGMVKCIASSNNKDAIEKFLQISGIGNRFDFYVSADEVKRGKPDPDIFLRACQEANILPQTALILEDSLNGLRAATAAGSDCIVVPDLLEPDEEMRNKAYTIASTLNNVIPIVQSNN